MLRLRFGVIMRPRSPQMACWLVDVGRPEEFVVRGADVAGRRRLSPGTVEAPERMHGRDTGDPRMSH